MIIALWVVNGLLALAFLGAGTMKLLKSKEAIVAGGMRWAEDVSPAGIKAIGAVELLGAIGLILPLLLNIAPVLAPIAAVGLVITMAVAVIVHVRLKEKFIVNLVLGGLALVSAVLGFLIVLG